AKNTLDADLRAYGRERIAETGIEVTELGVKDVILPGEIRELVNKVVEAERTAKANLIRRQEETAATRSLLNTAKLMEDNPLLLRLKELESLERRPSNLAALHVSGIINRLRRQGFSLPARLRRRGDLLQDRLPHLLIGLDEGHHLLGRHRAHIRAGDRGLLLHLRIAHRLAQGLAHLVHDVVGRSDRRDQRGPAARVEA